MVHLVGISLRGFTSNFTALLMLKRAKKMKGSKPQHKRLLGKSVSLCFRIAISVEKICILQTKVWRKNI